MKLDKKQGAQYALYPHKPKLATQSILKCTGSHTTPPPLKHSLSKCTVEIYSQAWTEPFWKWGGLLLAREGARGEIINKSTEM